MIARRPAAAVGDLTWYAVAHPGLEAVVASELAQAGHRGEVFPGGVRFRASIHAGAALARSLRTADRLLIEVIAGRAPTPEALGSLARRGDWKPLLHPHGALDIQVTSAASRIHFKESAARKVAWGIAEALKGPRLPEAGPRPRVTQRVQVRIVDDHATLSIDAAGDLLHKRGWRIQASRAPLRENLAAALIRLAEWDGREPLLDPFCGSGTIPIEAGLMAAGRSAHVAHPFACDEWPGLGPQRPAPASRRPTPLLLGTDHDAEAVRRAVENARRAQVDAVWRVADVADVAPLAPSGLVLTNPPWGGRIAARSQRPPASGHNDRPTSD